MYFYGVSHVIITHHFLQYITFLKNYKGNNSIVKKYKQILFIITFQTLKNFNYNYAPE
jgi:hypothetical protein